MNIFAIDLGNKRIKMKSERAEYSYPASYLTTDFLSDDSLEVHQEINDNYIYKLDQESTMSFVWGGALDIYNLPEKMIDTYARSKRIQQKKTQRILKFALGRLAFDYKERMSKETPLKVHVMLGAPITEMHKDSDTVAYLKQFLIGVHHLQINGEDIWLDVASEENISVIPQYMGTILDLGFDQTLLPVEKIVEGKIGVIDIGGGTVLINSSNALNLSPRGAEKFYGVQTLIREIASDINSTKPFIIEKLLREGSESNGYFYKTNRNERDIKDITGNVLRAVDNYTRFTISSLVTENFPDLEEFDFIIFTGGGASLLSKTALLDEIGEEYFSRLIFCETPELSNVRGFYKGGLLKWGGESLLGVDQDDLEKREARLEEKGSIQGEWGTASVEFNPETGILTVFEGQLSVVFPNNIERASVKEIHFEEGVSFPAVCTGLFGGQHYKSLDGSMSALVLIKGMERVVSTSVEDMSFMFNGCKSLTKVDFTNFDTSSVTNFSNLFANCNSLVDLNFENIDSSCVKNFDSMFLNCSSLQYLDLLSLSFNSAVTMNQVFEGCSSLEELFLPQNVFQERCNLIKMQ